MSYDFQKLIDYTFYIIFSVARIVKWPLLNLLPRALKQFESKEITVFRFQLIHAAQELHKNHQQEDQTNSIESASVICLCFDLLTGSL